MAEVISPRVILKSENYDGESGGFHAVYIQEPEDDSNSCRRHEEEEDNSLPRNANVESFDPTQFLQEEMFVEEERFVLRSIYKIKLKPFLTHMNLYNLSCGTRF